MTKGNKWRREGDSNPRQGYPCDGLANRSFRPLRHLSAIEIVSMKTYSGLPKLSSSNGEFLQKKGELRLGRMREAAPARHGEAFPCRSLFGDCKADRASDEDARRISHEVYTSSVPARRDPTRRRSRRRTVPKAFPQLQQRLAVIDGEFHVHLQVVPLTLRNLALH